MLRECSYNLALNHLLNMSRLYEHLFHPECLIFQAFCDKRLSIGYDVMKTSTAHSRLESLQLAAEECQTREEAQKILKKADKAHAKLESSAAPFHRPKN